MGKSEVLLVITIFQGRVIELLVVAEGALRGVVLQEPRD